MASITPFPIFPRPKFLLILRRRNDNKPHEARYEALHLHPPRHSLLNTRSSFS
jgi:hypothetical protein